jgi:myo-inositol-1(or 4)-monophosphatase
MILSIHAALKQAGELALTQPAAQSYQLKADRTPFTQVEMAMEDKICAFLRETFPAYQIISEENGVGSGESSHKWLLDPIDGTKMYLVGGSTWGISLGLLIHGKPALGFFYLPKSRDLFWGGEGYGAFFNDTPLDPAYIPDPENPLVFFGAPSSFHRRFEVRFPRIRILGSTALHLAFVASGASIGALTRRVYLWDLAGLLPVLEVTGVSVEFLSGKPFSPSDYLDGSRLPEELIVARASQMDLLRSLIRRLDR